MFKQKRNIFAKSNTKYIAICLFALVGVYIISISNAATESTSVLEIPRPSGDGSDYDYFRPIDMNKNLLIENGQVLFVVNHPYTFPSNSSFDDPRYDRDIGEWSMEITFGIYGATPVDLVCLSSMCARSGYQDLINESPTGIQRGQGFACINYTNADLGKRLNAMKVTVTVDSDEALKKFYDVYKTDNKTINVMSQYHSEKDCLGSSFYPTQYVGYLSGAKSLDNNGESGNQSYNEGNSSDRNGPAGQGTNSGNGTASGGGAGGGGSIAVKPSDQPNSIPESSQQGDQKAEQKLEPSPFFDGKEYDRWSDATNFATVSIANSKFSFGWLHVAGILLIAAGGGFAYWRWRQI